MNDENRNDDERYGFIAVSIMVLFLIFLTGVLAFVGGWGVAMGLMFAGVL